MNLRMVAQLLGKVLLTVAVLLLVPALVALIYRESPWPFLLTAVISALIGGGLFLFKPKSAEIFAPEGFVTVGLSWLLLSILGAVPFLISGDIPSPIDAFFETVSGFTTTGSSILTDIESLTWSGLFWRSMTQFLGGMGILVFLLAVLPMAGGRSMHIMRAEVPGPTVGKLVPSIRKSALWLYGIYVALTLLEAVFLLFGGLSFYDALIHAFATAGTGGFSNHSASIAYYDSTYVDLVVSVFTLLFGVNFNLFYLMLLGKVKEALGSEELHWYLGIILFGTVTIAWNLANTGVGFFHGLRLSFFQVTTLMSSTGYATADFTQWPAYSQTFLFILMFIGACAGSTGGGIKLSRILILGKAVRLECRRQLRPHAVTTEHLEGRPLSESTVRATLVYFACYFFVLFAGTMLLSFDGFDFATNFSASVTCLSNIGPGLNLVGPSGSFSIYSGFGKLVLSFAMLLGRLEFYPILMLFSPYVWFRRHR